LYVCAEDGIWHGSDDGHDELSSACYKLARESTTALVGSTLPRTLTCPEMGRRPS
jgi:hypothetical protein